MSTQNEKKGKARKVDPRKLAVRIIAWVLVLMMVITALYTAIFFIIEEVSASEADELNVAVGLVYGSSVDEAFTSTTTVGYTVGTEQMAIYEKTFTPLWSIPDTSKVSVLGDSNYAKTLVNSYCRSDENVVVGGYHIELDAVYADTVALTEAVNTVDTVLMETSVYAIPSYINGELRIRIGQYPDAESAEAALAEIALLFPEQTMHTVSPSDTGVTVVAHKSSEILFEYDCLNDSYLALEPIDGEDGTPAYTATPAGNLYDGVFVYKRYISTKDSIDGIQLVNVLPIEDYLLGVVPYEVSNSWPIETLKAFAVIARTFTVSEIGKYWSSYGFNLCNTTSSQVYKGIGRANDNVRTAVAETAGLVLTYNGTLAPVYYSSSVGDSTVDSRYIWGQNNCPWLRSVWTPWEDYRNHTYGFWTTEVSPETLQNYLNGKGYTSLTAPIASITVNETAGENSNYAYRVTVTDESGNSVVITRTDKVKSAFASYTYSANFNVGKGSATYTTYSKLLSPDELQTSYEGGFAVMTSLGKLLSSFQNGVEVITANGQKSFLPTSSVSVITADSYKNGTTASLDLNESLTDHLTTATVYAEDENNFIFVGKGWGHGVGLSQWGLHDLAELGLGYDEMLRAYCGAVSFSDYKELIEY